MASGGLVFGDCVAECRHEVADGVDGEGDLLSGHPFWPGAGSGRGTQAGVAGQLAGLGLGDSLADDGRVASRVQCRPVLGYLLVACADLFAEADQFARVACSWLVARSSIVAGRWAGSSTQATVVTRRADRSRGASGFVSPGSVPGGTSSGRPRCGGGGPVFRR
jgi:hypothetical protein